MATKKKTATRTVKVGSTKPAFTEPKELTMADRMEIFREGVANATKGLVGEEYKEFMGELITESEGWKMELEELEGEDELGADDLDEEEE